MVGMQELNISDVDIYLLLKQDKKINHHQRHIHYDSPHNSLLMLRKAVSILKGDIFTGKYVHRLLPTVTMY